MLITIKTLKQDTFQIQIESKETVRTLKNRIETVKGNDFIADNLKLIYAGQILNDNNTLESYKIEEKKYIVVMIKKPEATAGEASSSVVKENPKIESTGVVDEAAIMSESMLTGNEYNTAVNKLVQMGYERDAVVEAMRASFNNPIMAVEYLVNGLPDSDEASSGDESLSTMLRDQPEFNQIRRAIRNNPELLNAILYEIGQNNPNVLQYISDNQEAFLSMVNESSDESDQSMDTSGGGMTGGMAELPAGAISISPQDQQAIERLKALGFAEELVIQAYFACNKDENLTANCLLGND